MYSYIYGKSMILGCTLIVGSNPTWPTENKYIVRK
jgi:hypothetical protein